MEFWIIVPHHCLGGVILEETSLALNTQPNLKGVPSAREGSYRMTFKEEHYKFLEKKPSHERSPQRRT